MIDTGSTAFVLICAAMVMLMTPGVGLFYGGLVRRKNFICRFYLARPTITGVFHLPRLALARVCAPKTLL